MLQITKLSFSYGDQLLLNEIGWTIRPEKRYSLIGPNGAGKTTLLRLLAGELHPLRGNIIKPRDFQIGYLPQESRVFEGNTVLATALQAREDLISLEKQIHQLSWTIENKKQDYKKLVEKLGHFQQQYEYLGGYRYIAEAKSILAGLGFRSIDFERPVAELSGGWRMRVYLTRLLLKEPSLLLLDEPSNHLDLDSLYWLEQYLTSFSGSMIIVSHDRYFIDRLSNEIVELDRGKLAHYPGTYHQYEKHKLDQQQLLYKQYRQQEEERQRIQRFIDRFRYKAGKAAQVQSRIRQLEKMDKIEPPAVASGEVHFKLEPVYSSYHHVVHIENLYFRYQRQWVLNDIDLDIYRGQKIALVGPNGIGKTTLTRIISKELIPDHGVCELGKRVAIGYYAQHQVDALELDSTPYQIIEKNTDMKNIPHIRNVLGLFGIRNEDVNKKIGLLSGGEKARVSLAKLFLSLVNFLIMDEPTNHLDLASKQALEETLADYKGTLLLVSHDRYFLDKIVDKVIEITTTGLVLYEGNYTDYMEKRQAGDRVGVQKREHSNAGKKSKLQKRQKARARQQVSKERTRLQDCIAQLETRIDKLEKEKNSIEIELGRPENFSIPQKARSLQKDYELIKSDLEKTYQDWEENNLALEELLSNLQAKINSIEV